MGAGASVSSAEHISQVLSHANGIINKEDTSFMGVRGALMVILNSDGSRLALMKYLERLRMSAYLNFYFEVELIKNVVRESEVIEGVKQLKDHYDPLRSSSVANTKDSLTVWKYIDGINPDAAPSAIMMRLIVCQEKVVETLTSLLDEFLQSSEYKQWEKGVLASDERLSDYSPGGAGYSEMESSVSASEKWYTASCSSSYRRALLVDDSKVAAKLIQKMLEKNGHSVEMASNGRQALELCTKVDFDVIVLDLYMPIMDGFEAVRLFRVFEDNNKKNNTSHFRRTIVVGMSADGSTVTVNRAMDSGVDFFMEKPFSLNKFNAGMNRIEDRSNREERGSNRLGGR